ncbi:MAG: glycoside hydrolase 43 family protein [Cyclobacteriaceae bacterium]
MIDFKMLLLIGLLSLSGLSKAQNGKAHNPIIHADVPDVSIVRVGETYYMSSTTMHMNPGLPIMKSTDLVNWKLVSYAYETLGSADDLNLDNGQNMYGRGSWASCLRYVKGTYYVSTFSSTTGKTYIFSSTDPNEGNWEKRSFSPSYHDHSIFFDDDGKIYMIWGAGKLSMVQLKDDLTGVKEGTEQVLIEKAHAPIKKEIMLPGEGTQLFKVSGKYYLFNIAWPRGGMRTVIVHRADKITGPYEGRVMLEDKGVAQGGLIDTPSGDWYAYLFRDYGAVGRIPYLVPVKWEDGWPVLGEDGKVPDELNLPVNQSLIPGIVSSDDFKRKKGEPDLPLVWQWNHNPDINGWSIDGKKGNLRLTTVRVDSSIVEAKNILTQRTIGPKSSGIIKIDVSGMKEGDLAGLTLFQQSYGIVGVKYDNGSKYVVMIKNESDDNKPVEVERVLLDQDVVYLKATGDFKDRKDIGSFYYSLDNDSWNAIGDELHMRYTLPHFVGYRFGLFNYATRSAGGVVDFDYFRIME